MLGWEWLGVDRSCTHGAPLPRPQVSDGIKAAIGDGKLAAIFCVAGGWAGGNAASDGELCSWFQSTDSSASQLIFFSFV